MKNRLSSDGIRVRVIGPPLRRPPAGWDVRAPQASTRWAWGLEEASDVEKRLAPRSAPTYCSLRIAALILLSFVALNILILMTTVLPLFLGRLVMSNIWFLEWYKHDPFHFFIGL